MKVAVAVLFSLAVVSQFSSCAAPPPRVAPPAAPTPKPPMIPALLDDAAALAADSEFAITYPHEDAPGIRTIGARSLRSEALATAASSRKLIKSAALTVMEYRELLAMLRKLDETQFTASVADDCKEPFNVKLRVRERGQIFVGCRGSGPNSTVVSRLARELEFLLIQRTSQ